MANVPQFKSQVRGIADQTPYQSGDVPAGAFGVSGLEEVGGALQSVGNVVQKIALAEQHLDNERITKETTNKVDALKNLRLFGNDKDIPGYYNLTGNAAIADYPQMLVDIDGYIADGLTSLGDNNKAGRMYSADQDPWRKSNNVSAARHLGSAKLSAAKDASTARKNLAVEKMALEGGISDTGANAIEAAMATLRGEMRAETAFEGFDWLDPEEGAIVYRDKVNEAFGVAFNEMITARIQAGNTLEALALLDKYSTFIPEGVENNLRNLLKTPLNNTKAANLVERIRQVGVIEGWTLTQIEDQIRKETKDDIALQDEAIKRFKDRNVLDKKRRDEDRNKAFASTISKLIKGETTLKELETTEPALMAFLNEEPRMGANLRDADKARKEGQLYADVSDASTLDFLESAEKNKKLHEVTASDIRHSLTEGDYNFWRNKIMASRSLRNDQSDLSKLSVTWRKEIDELRPDLKPGKGDKKRSPGHQVEYDFLDQELIEFTQQFLERGETPNLAQIRERINELEKKVPVSGFFDELRTKYFGGVPLSEVAAGLSEEEQRHLVILKEEFELTTWAAAKKFMIANGTKSNYTDQEIASFITAKILTQEERAANIIGSTVQGRRPAPSLAEIKEAVTPRPAPAVAAPEPPAPVAAPVASVEDEAATAEAEAAAAEAALEEDGATAEEIAAVEALPTEYVEAIVADPNVITPEVQVDIAAKVLRTIDPKSTVEQIQEELAKAEAHQIEKQGVIKKLFEQQQEARVNQQVALELAKEDLLARQAIEKTARELARLTNQKERKENKDIFADVGKRFSKTISKKAARGERSDAVKALQDAVDGGTAFVPPGSPVPSPENELPEPEIDIAEVIEAVVEQAVLDKEAPPAPEKDESTSFSSEGKGQGVGVTGPLPRPEAISIVRAALERNEGARGSNVDGDPKTGKQGLSQRRWDDMKEKSGNPDLTEPEAIDMVLEEDFAAISKVEGWSGISIDAQVAVLDMTYNITSKWTKSKKDFPSLKAAMKKGDSVEVARQTLDTANKNVGGSPKSMMGLAERRARHYNDVVKDENKKIYEVIQTSGGKVTYKGKTKEILSYTPSGKKHDQSKAGTSILIKRPKAGLVGGA